MSAASISGMNKKMSHTHNGYVDDDDNDDVTPTSKRCCSCCRRKQRPGPKVPKISRRKKCINCCRKFVTFLFSHIGLTCLVAGYSALGGYIFMTLESPFEIKQRSSVGRIRQQAVDRLWNYTESLNILNKDHWKQSVNDKLKDFQLEVFKAVKEGGWDGSDETTTVELQWSFTGALLYSVTVITTIGYGHIAPKTVAGRLVTIAYAMVGIPLMLLCLANLGNFLASCFRVFYTQVLCCMCCDKKKPKGEPSALAVRSEMAPAYMHPRIPGMENGESMRGNFIDGSAIPQTAVICTLEDDREERPVTIPVVVTLLFMAGYIFCGTLLFTMWEKNWDYVEGSYFCFITLSTIGFGDFVPGTSIDSWHNEGKQVMCTLYLLFGLATVAMCFELMQAQHNNFGEQQEDGRKRTTFLLTGDDGQGGNNMTRKMSINNSDTKYDSDSLSCTYVRPGSPHHYHEKHAQESPSQTESSYRAGPSYQVRLGRWLCPSLLETTNGISQKKNPNVQKSELVI